MPADGPNSLTTAQARDHFAEILNRAAFGKERVVLTRRGKPLVAMVPIEDVAALEAMEDARDSAEVAARMQAWRESGRPGITIQDYLAANPLDEADDQA
jgi:prevent-host-death family protein